MHQEASNLTESFFNVYIGDSTQPQHKYAGTGDRHLGTTSQKKTGKISDIEQKGGRGWVKFIISIRKEGVKSSCYVIFSE